MKKRVTEKEASRLRRLRERAGLHQAQAADRIGCAQATLSRLESGERQPGTKALADRWRQVVERAARARVRKEGRQAAALEQVQT